MAKQDKERYQKEMEKYTPPADDVSEKLTAGHKKKRGTIKSKKQSRAKKHDSPPEQSPKNKVTKTKPTKKKSLAPKKKQRCEQKV